MRGKYFTSNKTIFGLLLICLYFFVACMPAARDNRSIVVQVVSQDENSKPLSGAVVVVQKNDKRIKSATTVEGGRVTLSSLANTPFQIKVTYPMDEVYLPAEIDIVENDFQNRSQIFKEIALKKKKTIITGKVIDAGSKSPVPVVSVKVEPEISNIVDTDKSGNFRIESPQFQAGIIYQVIFKREQPYENKIYKENQKILEDIKLYQINDLGTIELESMEIEATDVQDSQMEIKKSTGRSTTIGE